MDRAAVGAIRACAIPGWSAARADCIGGGSGVGACACGSNDRRCALQEAGPVGA